MSRSFDALKPLVGDRKGFWPAKYMLVLCKTYVGPGLTCSDLRPPIKQKRRVVVEVNYTDAVTPCRYRANV